MSVEVRKIRLGVKEYDYTLERKTVKNINLRVKPGEIIYVSAGKRVPVDVIEGFREFDNLIRYEVHQSQIWLIFFVKS